MVEKSSLITIAMPCFNAEDTIARAIKSAIAQTWENKEILIVDDASTDRSRDIINEIIRSIPYARLIESPANQGPGATRNVLLNQARGDFIAFFDDDDESLPERLSRQYERLRSYEAKNGERRLACYASGLRVYPNGYHKNLPAIGTGYNVPHGDGLAETILYYGRRQEWDYGSGTPTCCLMASTALLKSVGGFDETFRRVEDLDLTIRLALAGAHFIGCPETLFIQYATTGSDKSYARNLEAELKLAEKYKDFLHTRGMYHYALMWPKLRYYHFTKQYGRFAGMFFRLVLKHPRKTLTHLLDTGPKRLRHEKRMAE